MLGNKKIWKKNMSPMTIATFLFATSVMFFIGVVGWAYVGKSYAVGASALPNSLTVHIDGTWGGTVAEDEGLQYIPQVVLLSDFYGVDSNGTRYELYCLEHNKGMPSGGTYTKDGDLTTTFTDKGITYIVSNSYPNSSSFMSNYSSNEKKYVTQFAIWYYQDLVKGVAPSADGELSATIKQQILANSKYGSLIVDLANRAVEANKLNTPADSLGVDQSSVTYGISSDGKYFESNYISVVGSNDLFRTYAVTLTDNTSSATLVDEAGAEVPSGSVFRAGSKFKIRVPLNNLKELNKINIKANITGTFEHQQVFAYRHSNTGAQTALVAAFDTDNQNTDLALEFNIPTGKVQISKQDITNSKEVAGATLVITDCNGVEIAKWVSTTEPHYIEALPITTDNCKYKLTETIAPSGYEINTESIEFEVKADGSVTKVVMKDTPLTPTPETGMNIPTILYIAGGFLLICGIAIIYESVKPKKENY